MQYHIWNQLPSKSHSGNAPPAPGTGSSNQRSAKFYEKPICPKLKNLLDEKIADLDSQLMHLQAIRTTLCTQRQHMDALLTMDLSEISMIEHKERCLVTVDVNPDASFEEDVELITAETEKYHIGRLHDASYDSMISVSSLQSGNFDDYSKLFIELPFLTYQSTMHTTPRRKYLRAFHNGS